MKLLVFAWASVWAGDTKTESATLSLSVSGEGRGMVSGAGRLVVRIDPGFLPAETESKSNPEK